MSELKVNKISPRSGTDVTLGDSGDTFSVPSGATLDASSATLTLPDDSVTTAKIVDANITTAKIADANITTAKLADANITTAKLAYDPNPFRNILINGDMSLAQRGTSTASVSSAGYYSIDRWRVNGQTFGAWTQSQSTDVPTGQGFAKSFKMDCTTANASLSSNSFSIISQRIEGQNLQYIKKGTANAESLTLSFWVKSNKTGTYIAEIFDEDNTRQISKAYTIDDASTWEKKTITFAGDTTGTLDNDNARSFEIDFWLLAGTDYTSGTLNTSWNSNTNANRAVGQVNLADDTANEWYITGVQLEAGTTASDFEFLPVDVNLNRCFRYFYKFGPDSHEFFGYGYATNNAVLNINLPTSMRTAPSFTKSGTYIAYNGTNATSTPSFTANTATTIMLSPSASMTVTQTDPCRVYSNNSGVFSISAEL
jgi:hypothetical protein